MHERSEMLMLVRSLLHYLNVSDVDAYRPSRRYSRRYSGGGGRAAVTLKLLLPLARSLSVERLVRVVPLLGLLFGLLGKGGRDGSLIDALQLESNLFGCPFFSKCSKVRKWLCVSTWLYV